MGGILLVACVLLSLSVYGYEDPEGRKIRQVIIKGNRVALDGEIRSLMGTRPTSWLRRRRFRWRTFRADLKAILTFYQNNGFLEVDIPERRVTVDPATEEVSVYLRIHEGRRFYVAPVVFTGNQAFSDDTLNKLLWLREGAVYQRLKVDEDRAALQLLYTQKGWMDALVHQEVNVDEDAALVHIRYDIEEGAPVTIGSISIVGLKRSRERIVRRELTFRSGERYNVLNVMQSQRNLFRTGLFAHIAIRLQGSPGETVRDVMVEVHERPAGELNMGLGYGASDRGRISMVLVHRNLTGRGMGIGFKGKASRLERRAELSFTNPWLFNTRTNLDLNAFYRFIEAPAYTTEGVGTTADVGRTLSKHTSWRGGIQWTREAHIGGERNVERTKLLFGELLWDTRDHLFNARRGAMRRIEIQQAGGLLGGTNAFVRIRAEGRIFRPLGRHILLAHAVQIGWLIPLRGGEIAVAKRFYAGGAQSVRGFREGAIGVRGEGEPSGGRFLATWQNELRIRPGKTWGGACFVDLGAVWLDRRAMRWESIQVGFGIGLRFASPFGLIRLDLGWPARTSKTLRRVQYYIGIGQAF